MYDDMTLEDAIELLAKRRERHERRARIFAWFKFTATACVFAALAILR